MGRKSNAISDAFKQKNPKNKKAKTVLVFDETARQNYLTGFSKRKQERKRVAQEKIVADLKEEKKRIKLQKRQDLNEKWEKLNQKLDFEHIVQPKVYDLSAHTVTVTDISDVDFAASAAFKLGTNQASTEDTDSDPEDNVKRAADDSDQSGDESSQKNGDEESKQSSKERKRKKHKGKHHKNLTHLMSKHNQAKQRRKRKLQAKMPANMKSKTSGHKHKKHKHPKR